MSRRLFLRSRSTCNLFRPVAQSVLSARICRADLTACMTPMKRSTWNLFRPLAQSVVLRPDLSRRDGALYGAHKEFTWHDVAPYFTVTPPGPTAIPAPKCAYRIPYSKMLPDVYLRFHQNRII